jgi:peptidyl-prolyl cis-trans isomerase SurA
MHRLRLASLALALGLTGLPAWSQLKVPGAPAPATQPLRTSAFAGDYIVAVVNSELVTAGELEQRVARVRAMVAQRGGPPPPTEAQLGAALESLIEERVMLTHARKWLARRRQRDRPHGTNIAAQNKLSAQLRDRLAAEGMDMKRLRETRATRCCWSAYANARSATHPRHRARSTSSWPSATRSLAPAPS